MGRKYQAPVTDRTCDAAGCDKMAPYRAPRPRGQMGSYWFCLDHVRDYNANWDWFRGMSPSDIEAAQRDATTWERKTWARQISPAAAARFFGVHDIQPDDTLAGTGPFSETAQERDSSNPYEQTVLPKELRDAFQTLGLPEKSTQTTIRETYRRLVKAHHPDLGARRGASPNGEALKAITAAYGLLRKTGYV